MAKTADSSNSQVVVGSEEHRRLVELVRSRRDYSSRHISARYPSWRQSERTMRAFVDTTETNTEGKLVAPFASSIVLPVTQAVVQTQLAFDLAAFTQNQPVVQLDGENPSSVRSAKVMEQVLEWEWRKKRMIIELMSWLFDRRRYGVGILWNRWTKNVSYVEAEEDRTISLPLLGLTIPRPPRKFLKEVVQYEGNEAYATDPFRFWPDPRVPIARIQDGEFVGRTIRRSFSYLLEQEAAGFYQNVNLIPPHTQANLKVGGTEPNVGNSSDRERSLGLTSVFSQFGDTTDFQDRGYVDLDEFVIKMVPRRYGLDDSDRPQKWWITMANDSIIVRAERFGYDHDEFPVAIMEGNIDAHSQLNQGTVEQLQPLQTIASYLWNSHYENVRKFLNDSLVVNPKYIMIEDILAPQPGRLIRLKPEAQNIPNVMDQAVKQLQVGDVTQTHLRDIRYTMDMINRLSAMPDSMQGAISQQDRTLGEQEIISSNASARLRMEMQLAWAQGMVPWCLQRVKNIQQLLEDDRFIKIVGDFPKALGIDISNGFLHVDPDTIRGEFIFKIIEGNVRNSQMTLQTWQQMFLAISQNPQLSQTFNVIEVFKYLAQLHGITNVDDFINAPPAQGGLGGPLPPAGSPGAPSVKVMPDDQVADQVKKGNLTPLSGAPLPGSLMNG